MLNKQLEGEIHKKVVKFLKEKQKFWKFEGQFDDQRHGHLFANPSETFKANLTLKIKVKATMFQTCQTPLYDQYRVQV